MKNRFKRLLYVLLLFLPLAVWSIHLQAQTESGDKPGNLPKKDTPVKKSIPEKLKVKETEKKDIVKKIEKVSEQAESGKNVPGKKINLKPVEKTRVKLKNADIKPVLKVILDKYRPAKTKKAKTEEPGSSLLTIKDGQFKYERIPGYMIDARKETVEAEDNSKLVKIPDKIIIEDTEPKDEGLFGLSKGMADILVKGFLFLLIFLILLLYRARSKGSNYKVLKRYPK